MRQVIVIWHRFIGLFIAGFLVISGVTGAVISWDHELDELLNPHLINAQQAGQQKPPIELAAAVEARDPRVQVLHIPLAIEGGHSIDFYVEPKVDPKTGQLLDIDYNQVFVDPVSGAELGRRYWGSVWPLSTENFVSFLYVLHYSLHIPEMWGIDRWGVWLMGTIALLWTIDCIGSFFLTLPTKKNRDSSRSPTVQRQLDKGYWQRWKPAWQIKTTGSAYRINFDIHRAFGLWTWLLLFVLAFTAFSLNLYREIFYPVMSMVSQVTPSPYDLRQETNRHKPIEPRFSYPQVLDLAAAEARKRNWTTPPGSIGYARNYGIYNVSFYLPGDDHGAAGVGPPELYFDGLTGAYLGDKQPWVGTAADIFVQAQFPIHSGRILGLPGRILISIMGLVVAALSITGVIIWWKKRNARVARNARPKRELMQQLPAE